MPRQKKKKGGALGRARRASVTLAGMMGKGKDAKELEEASDSSEEDEGGPSHVVRAGDDEANIAHLLHTLEPPSKKKSPEQVKKKVGRVRRMSVNLAEAMAAKADDAAPPEEDEEDDYDPAPGATTPSGAGSQDGSPEQPKKKKGFVRRMRRMSVDAVQKVATAVAGQELVDEAAAAAEEGKAPPRAPRTQQTCVATVDEFVVPVSRLGTLRPCGRAKVPATIRGPRHCRTWSGRTGAPPESRRR